MKRIACLALALCLIAGILCGCGKKKEGDKDKQSASSAAVSSAVASAAPASPAPVKTAKAAKVKADDGLNIRSKPSTEGEILGLAENGSMLPLLVGTPDDGWYEVEYEGKSAYVSAEYVDVQDVTLEEYNRLKKGESSSEPAPDDDPAKPVSSEGASSKAPVSSAPVSSAGPVGGAEDGE